MHLQGERDQHPCIHNTSGLATTYFTYSFIFRKDSGCIQGPRGEIHRIKPNWDGIPKPHICTGEIYTMRVTFF